jgi:hypothetical protein
MGGKAGGKPRSVVSICHTQWQVCTLSTRLVLPVSLEMPTNVVVLLCCLRRLLQQRLAGVLFRFVAECVTQMMWGECPHLYTQA